MTAANGNGAEYKKINSRKWRLTLLILLITTIGTFVPPIISTWFLKYSQPLEVLSGGHFVTLVTLIISAYFGMNVWQKKIEKDAENNLVKIQSDSNSNTATTVTTATTEITTEKKVAANETGEA